MAPLIVGKDMHATSENLTVKEYAAILESSLGKEVKTLGMSKEEFMNDVKTDRELWLNYLAIINRKKIMLTC